MNLQEWIEENKNKEVVFEDGKLTIKDPETNGRWKSEDGDVYFTVLGTGEVNENVWSFHIHNDSHRFAIGNVFKTEEEARNMIERLKIRAEMLDLGGREEFRANQKNFYISGDIQADTIFATNSGGKPYLNAIYFDTRDEAKKAINAVGVHRLKKMLFGENRAQ